MFKKTHLFKKNNYPSWSINDGDGLKVFIHRLNHTTSWPDWMAQVKKCSRLGTGYKIETYARQRKGMPIKKITPNKPKKSTVENTFAQGFIKFGIEQGYIK